MDFFDIKSAKSLEFGFFFNKTKEEKAYIRDSFDFSKKSRDFFMISAPFLFFYFEFSIEKPYIPLFKLLLSLLLWKIVKIRVKNPILMRILLEIWLLAEILTGNFEVLLKKRLFPMGFLGMAYNTFTSWSINLLFLIFDHFLLSFFLEKPDFPNILLDFGLILLIDLKLRGFWLILKEEKHKNLAFSYIFNRISSFFILIDHKMRILASNETAKKFFFENDRKKANFNNLIREKDLEKLEKTIINSRTSSDNDFNMKIELNSNILKEIEENQIIKEEKLTEFIEKLNILKPIPPEEEKSPEKSTMKITNNASFNANINENVNKTTKSKEKNEKRQFLPLKTRLFPLMFDRKAYYFLSMDSQGEVFNFFDKMKEFLFENHVQAMEMLQKLEQDYIKWNNMQGLSIIKESDLKNLGFLIYEFNFNLSFIFIHYSILPPRTQIHKDFNISSLLAYILELISIKAMNNNHELTLFFEASFPDFVSGQFFLFKYTVLLLLNLMVNEFEFPKHSKFKISGKLKEYMSIGNDNHFRLSFEFDYPHNPGFTDYLKLLLHAEELKDPMVFLTSSKNRLQTNKNSLIYLQELLKCLEANIVFKEKGDGEMNQSFWLETSFKTVDLSTMISSPAKSLTINNIAIQRRDYNKVNIPNINLSFCKNVNKKNLIIWKNRPIVVNRPKNNAVLLTSLQKNIELNESFKRKISVRNKEESPANNRKNSSNDSPNPKSHTNKELKEKTNNFNFEENLNFNFSVSQKISEEELEIYDKPIEKKQKNIEKNERNDNPNDKIIKDLHNSDDNTTNNQQHKAKSLDFEGHLESPERLKSNQISHKSHFSNYDFPLKDQKNPMITSEFRSELEKLVQLNKSKIKKILTKSILLMLKKQISSKINKDLNSEGVQSAKIQRKIPLDLKIELGNLNFIESEAENEGFLLESKSATIKKDDDISRKPQFKKGKTLVSGKSNPKLEISTAQLPKRRIPLSPRKRTPKKTMIENLEALDVMIDENLESEETVLKKSILPYDFDLDDSMDIGLNFLFSRVETQKRRWEMKKLRSDKRINYQKLKKSQKFFMLVIDDNINHLNNYQKLSYNPGLIIDFSDNFKRGMEIFLQTLEQGKCYDIVILELGDKIKEGIEFIREIREIEKNNKVGDKEKVHLSGFLNKKEEAKKAELIEMGLNEVYFEEVDEELLRKIVEKTNRGTNLMWKS